MTGRPAASFSLLKTAHTLLFLDPPPTRPPLEWCSSLGFATCGTFHIQEGGGESRRGKEGGQGAFLTPAPNPDRQVDHNYNDNHVSVPGELKTEERKS